MANINKAAVLNPFTELTANILDYVPRATTSEFGIVAIGSGIKVDALGRIYLDTQEYSDRLTAIEAEAASTLATQQTEVAAAIAQVNLAQSQTITALTLEVNNLKTNLTKSDVGLANVDNTPDAQKPISVATQQALDTKVNTSDVIAIANGGTGATNVEDARVNLGISSVRLPAGTDLNNIINEGNYYCDTDNDAATVLNSPYPSSFTLQVYLTAGIVQRITYYHGVSMLSYRRAMYEGQWRAWDRELSENFPSETIELQLLSETSNEALIRKLTKGAKSGFFFNGASGTAFKQYSAGFYASLFTGAFSAIATDAVSGEVRTLSGVLRDSGLLDFVNTKTLLAKGDYGIGSSLASLGRIDIDITGSNPDLRTGMYESDDIIGSFTALNSVYGTLLIGGSTYGGNAPQYVYYNSQNGNKQLRASAVHTFRTTQNTWVDGNGFIKVASPVVELYANEIKLNNEAKDQDIVFEKVDVGSYLLKGTTGLAQDGWYIEQPKDSNGNIFHAVEYGTHDNGDIWIKTYEQIMDGTRIVADHNKPIDIKENRFISLRLNELPKDTTAPINPTVKDNEGNPAPNKYHVLEEGVWVISDENAAILEQKRLAAMKPLTRRQFRLTLAMNGYDLNEIEALIDQIEDPMQRTIAQIEWQDSTDFERTNPSLLMMAELLQLTSEHIDQLWSYGLAL